ncbi:MAG: class 1 fructose-bisphosphatase [Rhizobacter sp.]|nr:class 1 fructose-bisphosphatase [Chlorobiales bacterium]
MANLITIERHILEQQKNFPNATGELSQLLSDVAFAAKLVRREVIRAGLVDILGTTGATNIQGEQVKKLDEFANERFIQGIGHHGRFCVMASEENEGIIETPGDTVGKYVLLFDPLDGSSNIDANVSVGSIFSIFKRKSKLGRGTLQDCLQRGMEQVAAGYVIYGSSVMLVYTTGQGVHGFTLDPTVGEFLLSHPYITVPKRGQLYSINEGYYRYFYDGIKKYIKYLQQEDKATGRPYSGRYIGSLVADFHRNLLYGGIFIYPRSRKNPDGKLRLMYEANPVAFICEQAGGRATDGYKRILELEPEGLHQRTPLFIGSDEDVRIAEEFEQGLRQLEHDKELIPKMEAEVEKIPSY